MTDEPIPARNGPDFRDLREPAGDRAYLNPHQVIDPDTNFQRMMFPAMGMTLGQIHFPDGRWLPSIRMDSMVGPAGLVFLPTLEEMRAICAQLTRDADSMEAAAKRMADEAIAQAMKGGRGDG
jgi:hypothetical protein